jgi:hypothetical protein
MTYQRERMLLYCYSRQDLPEVSASFVVAGQYHFQLAVSSHAVKLQDLLLGSMQPEGEFLVVARSLLSPR